MTEVFKTNVQLTQDSELLIDKLREHLSCDSRISFDLEDCDRVLRIEKCFVLPGKVIEVLEVHGYLCEILQ